MSGGFFRGTSADQDTRFSNKTAKLLKTQKFAPELDQLIDMSKVHLDSMRPWIANRVTQLLGFEDEVLINFIYGLLEEKNVDGKHIQIQLTGFMEKNTGKFMKELWGLLTSAQNSTTGIPQQLLDEKAEEIRLKKAEEQRVISEVRRKEDERRFIEEARKRDKDDRVDFGKGANPTVSIQGPHSPSKGRRSPEVSRAKRNNGTSGFRPSRSRSVSAASLKSVSRSPSPLNKRHTSGSKPHSPLRQLHRSRSPRRHARLPSLRRRSRSMLRRAWSPASARSPRRRQRSRSRSPRHRSPIPAPKSPRRLRTPQYSRSPHRRSPIVCSPRRRRSPVYTRSPPHRRTSLSPRQKLHSPYPDYSPVRRYRWPSLSRHHHHHHHHHHRHDRHHHHHSPRYDPEFSPHRRVDVKSSRRVSRYPMSRSRSLSPEDSSKFIPCNQRASRSPERASPSPSHHSAGSLSPPLVKSSFAASPCHKSPLSSRKASRGSISPGNKTLPFQYQSSQSPSPRSARKGYHSSHSLSSRSARQDYESPHSGIATVRKRASPSSSSARQDYELPHSGVASVRNRASPPSSSPPRLRRSSDFSDKSAQNGKTRSRSPVVVRELRRERSPKGHQQEHIVLEKELTMRKRTRSSSRGSSPMERRRASSSRGSSPMERRRAALPDKPSVSNSILGGSTPVIRHRDKDNESLLGSSNDEQQVRLDGKQRHTKYPESEGMEEHGPISPASLDRKAARKRRKEERRLRKEEKRRKREERHKRKEEKRANRALLKGVTSVTPPPDFHKSTGRSDDYDSGDEGNVSYDEDAEFEQEKLETELRRRALDSIRAKKGCSS